METKQLVENLTDFVNSFGDKSKEFNALMERQHRTLQNSYTRLALAWIEHVASPEYQTDARNASSKAVCRKLMKSFKETVEKDGYTGDTLELMCKPSGYCGFV